MKVIMFTKITKVSNLSIIILINKIKLFLKAPYFDNKKLKQQLMRIA